jgi:NADPH2:quinone reductase
MHAVQVKAIGDPEALEYGEVPEPEPGPGQVLIAVEAIGVNFIDVYRRNGLYQVPLPMTPGDEAAGTVLAVGPGVTAYSPGDRVVSSSVAGAYAERALAPADLTAPVPEGVSLESAAAVLLQGLTAHYLCRDTFPLRAGRRAVVHAAAGGVGLLLVQMAKQIGAEVFATVGSPEKAELAKQAGADHVVVTSEEDFGTAFERIAGPKAMDVVYDGVGRATFAAGLDLLRPRGMMVTFGNASGPVDPISPLLLSSKGSLFLTRPTLANYVATPEEFRGRADDVLAAVAAGRLSVRIGTKLPLAEAAQAHRLLESRATTGKVVLVP